MAQLRSQQVKKVVQIHPHDNVAVALVELVSGDRLQIAERDLIVRENVPRGHKIALTNLNAGDDVIKYNAPIGRALAPINAGEWVHTHNVQTKLSGRLEYTYEPTADTITEPLELEGCFRGYPRSDGQVGIRNELWIIPTVHCVNRVSTLIAEAATDALADAPWFDSIDGIYAFPHPYGCSQGHGDHEQTQKLLAALVNHPNAGGVLVLGLGCENNRIDEFQKVLGDWDPQRVKFLIAQEVEDEVAAGVRLLEELGSVAGRTTRQAMPLSSLKIGLKCGGSDGLSGITANPLLGEVSDAIIACGGTTVMTEVPEMFGAEQLLMNRAINEEVFQKIVEMINGFKEYFMEHNQPIYENPSLGNKDGGITTLEDKSLGCTQKGGSSPVVDVLGYAEPAQRAGLNLLYGPGNDGVAVTNLAAAGCQMILFTTGRGTPLGTCVPTLKISTNSALANRKRHWMDFDAGRLLAGESMDTLTQELLELIIETASGAPTRNEMMGFREITIFKNGVTA